MPLPTEPTEPTIVPFHLPLPPSINHLYIGIGHHKSKFYKAWLLESKLAMRASHPIVLFTDKATEWELAFTCVMPNWRRRDLDNTFKPLIDFLADYLGLEDNRLLAIAAVKEVVGGQSHVCGEVRIG